MENWREIEDEAWEYVEQGNLGNAARCARSALSQEPNAIDSYVILALSVETVAEKTALLREAVRLGEEMFASELAQAPRDDFPFWAVLETRPYMRALHNLSLVLVEDERPGSMAEAVEIWRKLNRICPNDNLGVRFLIAEFEERGTVDLSKF